MFDQKNKRQYCMELTQKKNIVLVEGVNGAVGVQLLDEDGYNI